MELGGLRRLQSSATVDIRVLFALMLLGAVVFFAALRDGRELVIPVRQVPEPLVFTVTPEGSQVDRLAPIKVTYARPPAERDPAKLVQVEPAVEGEYIWQTARTLIFQPAFPGLLRGKDYTVSVPPQPDAGHFRDFRRSFTTAGELSVVSVIPGPEDIEVPDNVQVLVQFTRSVAPLTVLSEQLTAPVVHFSPPLAGTGEWLNTSLYRFVPASGALQPNTRYEARIAAGLTAEPDGILKQDFVWAFTTFGPALASVTPDRNTQYVGPSQTLDMAFNQPMDRASVQAGVRLTGNGVNIPGALSWSDDSTRVSLIPSSPLPLATTFEAVVPSGLRGANGGETKTEQRITFTTVGTPAVVSTDPPNGSTGAQRYGTQIVFNNPMDEASFEGRISVSGIPSDEIYLSLHPNGLRAHLNTQMEPSTQYTVSLAQGITDRYGQPLPPYTFSFTTGARPPQVTMAIPNDIATYSAYAEPILYFHAINTAEAQFTLYPLTRAELLSLQQMGFYREFIPSQPAIATWTEDTAGPLDEVLLRSTSLSRNGGPLPRGDYYVSTNSNSAFGDFRSKLAFSVIDTAMVTKLSYDELLVWAFDIATGEPVANLPVTANGPTLANAVKSTDADGLVSFPAPVRERRNVDDRGFVVSSSTGGRFGISHTTWQQGAYTWDSNLPFDSYQNLYVGHVYTDRPIYRIGEEVLFKAVIREDDDAFYTVPDNLQNVRLEITDSEGRQFLSQDVTINEYGTFASSLTLPEDASTGYYSIQIRYEPEGPRQCPPFCGRNTEHITSTAFLVAEFRRPEFQVTAETEQPYYISGETVRAQFEATFFFGGAVEGAAVDWTAFATPYNPRFEGYARYSFADYDYYRRQETFEQPTRATGRVSTNANGLATVEVPATISGNEGPQRYEVSAAVQDESGQAVAGSTSVIVHPAAAYAGIRPAEYIAFANQPSTIEVVSVDVDGKPLSQQAVTVNVYERTWVTSKEQTPSGARRYRSEPRDTLIATLETTTNAKGEGTVQYTPTKTGTLRLVAEIQDSQGRISRSAGYLWVSGREYASWQVTNDDTIQLIADKDEYEVGDTAEILVPAPFEAARGLVTVERGKIIERDVRDFPTNSERLQVKIGDRSVPTIYVSVVLYRPPTAEDPVPRYKVGYVRLPVRTDTRVLDVRITPDTDQAKPGDTVKYDIQVRDHNGKGVKSEVSVAVVDKAVHSLAEDLSETGLAAFWFDRALGVSTASSMAVSIDRSNDVISEAASGGKGGGGDEDRLRSDFRNTAYWEAQLTTDSNGRASVEVKMPDNLTTWRMQVRAISGDILVGEAVNELLSTQPLLLRPALPRFLRVGDTVSLRTLVRNATKEPRDVEVSLEASGVEVADGGSKTVRVAPGASEEVLWTAAVTGEGTATVRFAARANGGFNDAVENTLPVFLDITPETTATGGVVTDHEMIESIYIPPYTIQAEGRGSLEVSVQPSLIGALTTELGQFRKPIYGPESTDHIASRVIATLAAHEADPQALLPWDDSQLRDNVAELISRQLGDGGWPWCRSCTRSDPQVTGWVLQALGAWESAGNTVSRAVTTTASEYIHAHIQRFRDVQTPTDPNMKAYLLYSLAAAGRSDLALSTMRSVLEQDRSNLKNWARAYLLLGFNRAGLTKSSPEVQALLNDLAANVIPSANGNHWEDERLNYYAQTGPRTTALVLTAMSKADPQHPLIEETARWLVVALNTDVCKTGLEKAQAIVALSNFVQSTGERGASYPYSVRLDNSPVLSGVLDASGDIQVQSKTLSITELTRGKTSLLSLVRDYTKAGRMYYALNLRYVTPAQSVEALNRGFAISHQYSLLSAPDTPIDSARVGEIVRVTLTVMLPADRNYVVVEDLLPAGLEPIDPNLKVVDPALKAQLDAERSAANRPEGLDYYAPWYRWYYNPWQQADMFDDRVRLQTDALAKGVYEFIYYARATTPGDFYLAPAHAEESYFPEVFGRSDSGRFEVLP